MILAPGINIHRSPLGGRNFEYMSEDPYLTAEIAVPFVEGIQQNDVSACVLFFVFFYFVFTTRTSANAPCGKSICLLSVPQSKKRTQWA